MSGSLETSAGWKIKQLEWRNDKGSRILKVLRLFEIILGLTPPTPNKTSAFLFLFLRMGTQASSLLWPCPGGLMYALSPHMKAPPLDPRGH